MGKIIDFLKNLTIIEIMIIIAIIGIVIVILAPIASFHSAEEKAENNLEYYIENNNIKSSRYSCASDLDDNGFVSCNLVTTDNEKLYLRCPTYRFYGKNCKEIPVVQFK